MGKEAIKDHTQVPFTVLSLLSVAKTRSNSGVLVFHINIVLFYFILLFHVILYY